MMIEKYQIVPDSEHYTCLVDLVARAGFLDEAFNILNSIPNEAGPGTLAAGKLFALEPKVPVNYTIMSSIYSSKGGWLDVARLRKLIRSDCDLKSLGCSWVEISGEIHTFVSSDQSHSKAVEVYAMLGLLCRLIKEEMIVAANSKSLLEEYAS
ncbi:hypothetical protein PanWU01x14_098750 [Parasponia andersonii]|uniref:Pentatricopeptide repeat n=1 Tax=Parasponia andersonii TaxID=3476 RepID=A0A2P5D453_PARAD|nr:hypothetical protein PanWU01x14_098750 [Parasponia andersonii]